MNVQTAYDALKCCFIKREREREKRGKVLSFAGYIFYLKPHLPVII